MTNEIKSKVFGQYIGQKMAYWFNGSRRPDGEFDFLVLKEIFRGVNEYDAKLILRPLSEITDEDAIEVCRMIVSTINYPRTDYIIKRHNTSLEVKLDNSHFSESVYIGYSGNVWTSVKHPRYGNNVFQFLASKGYDQMQYLLNNQTLREAGLAIYSQDK